MDYLVDENEGSNEYEFVVYSIFDKAAKKKSKIYKNTKFVYIPINRNLNKINNFIIKVVRKIFKIELKTLLIREIIKYLRKENFDKIIVEGNEVQILQLRKYYKGKLYFHAHHDAFNTCKINPNKIIDSCEKVITVSEYIKERTLNVCSVKNYDKIIKVENCIDNKVFNKMLYIDEKIQLRNKYGIKDDELVIMFTGRIIKEKGVKELIEALKKKILEIISLDKASIMKYRKQLYNSCKTKFSHEKKLNLLIV